MTSSLFYSGPTLAALHEHYARNGLIDEAAQLTCSVSTVISAPPARVWAVLQDVAGWPAWYPAMRVLELTSVRPGAPFRWRLRGLTMRSVFARVQPGRELTWTGRFLWYKAVDRHLIEEVTPGQTRVTSSESLAGPLLPWLYSPAKLRAGHLEWLAALTAAVAAAPDGAGTPGRPPAAMAQDWL
jgi:hypothetical protein